MNIMINKPLRSEQLTPPRLNATGGIVVTTPELEAAIGGVKNGAMFNYQREVPSYLRTIARNAEIVGRLTCRSETCALVCTGVNLLDCVTPVSLADGDLTARCTNETCTQQPADSAGMQAAIAYMQVEVGVSED